MNTVSAQYGNSGYNNGYNNGYGGNNRMSQLTPDHRETPKAVPIDEIVSKIVANLKKEINFDVLQEIAVTNVIKKSLQEEGIILKKEGSQEDKIRDMQALSETTDRKIMDFLNKDQKEKYTALAEKRKK